MKIIEVINAMIEKKDRINEVYKTDKEIFFLYNGKYKWSITTTDSGEYILYFYPKTTISAKQMSAMDPAEFAISDIETIAYRTSEIKTKESTESFSELYQIVSSKLYGIDEIFDEIINN